MRISDWSSDVCSSDLFANQLYSVDRGIDTLIADPRAHAHALSFEIGLQCHADLGLHSAQQAAAATDSEVNTEGSKHMPQHDPDQAPAHDQQRIRSPHKHQSRSTGKAVNSVTTSN